MLKMIKRFDTACGVKFSLNICKFDIFYRYHQSYSVAEILCNEVRKYEDRTLPELALQTFDHPFPYGLNIPEQEVIRVTKMCANVKVLNLVSLDNTLPAFSNFKHLTKATIGIRYIKVLCIKCQFLYFLYL